MDSDVKDSDLEHNGQTYKGLGLWSAPESISQAETDFLNDVLYAQVPEPHSQPAGPQDAGISESVGDLGIASDKIADGDTIRGSATTKGNSPGSQSDAAEC
jgi:hypothetical protein